jgi:Natural resistance-associated macrophage protein
LAIFGNRHYWNDNCSLAAFLPTKLRGRQAPALFGSALGEARYTRGRGVHDLGCRLHDVGRRRSISAALGVHRTCPNGRAIGWSLGPFLKNAILLMMVNAAVLGTTTISLSSAWAYGEVRGWPHSLQKPVSEAPGFYTVYALCVMAAAGLVLIPGAPLQLIILSVQVLAGLMLPSAIIFLQLLLNDKEVLGEGFANKRWNNAVNWTIVILLFILSLLLAVQVAAPRLFPSS